MPFSFLSLVRIIIFISNYCTSRRVCRIAVDAARGNESSVAAYRLRLAVLCTSVSFRIPFTLSILSNRDIRFTGMCFQHGSSHFNAHNLHLGKRPTRNNERQDYKNIVRCSISCLFNILFNIEIRILSNVSA